MKNIFLPVSVFSGWVLLSGLAWAPVFQIPAPRVSKVMEKDSFSSPVSIQGSSASSELIRELEASRLIAASA